MTKCEICGTNEGRYANKYETLLCGLCDIKWNKGEGIRLIDLENDNNSIPLDIKLHQRIYDLISDIPVDVHKPLRPNAQDEFYENALRVVTEAAENPDPRGFDKLVVRGWITPDGKVRKKIGGSSL